MFIENIIGYYCLFKYFFFCCEYKKLKTKHKYSLTMEYNDIYVISKYIINSPYSNSIFVQNIKKVKIKM